MYELQPLPAKPPTGCLTKLGQGLLFAFVGYVVIVMLASLMPESAREKAQRASAIQTAVVLLNRKVAVWTATPKPHYTPNPTNTPVPTAPPRKTKRPTRTPKPTRTAFPTATPRSLGIEEGSHVRL